LQERGDGVYVLCDLINIHEDLGAAKTGKIARVEAVEVARGSARSQVVETHDVVVSLFLAGLSNGRNREGTEIGEQQGAFYGSEYNYDASPSRIHRS
jgi:hypothetical protein